MSYNLEFLNAKQLARRLNNGKAIKAGKGYLTCCPAHDDKNPSLSVIDGDKGTIVLCHAGCPFVAIIAALNAMDISLRPLNGEREKCRTRR